MTTKYTFHPKCALFPIMSGAEQRALADDIKKNGLRSPIVLDKNDESVIVEGRNRFLACERVNVEPQFVRCPDDDPTAVIISANIHRRHLTAEQRRDLLIEVLKAQPEKSNVQIAKQTGVSDKTVAAARKKGEDVRSIPNVAERTDSKGRKQPARKRGRASSPGAKTKAAVNAKDPPKQSPSDAALAELKFAINLYVPRLDADDLKKARAIFEATASTSGALRANGSAEVPEDVRRAEWK
jgi:ParB-like chromosome segregation protein Spo0J